MRQGSGNAVQNSFLIAEPTTSKYPRSSQSLLISIPVHLLSQSPEERWGTAMLFISHSSLLGSAVPRSMPCTLLQRRPAHFMLKTLCVISTSVLEMVIEACGTADLAGILQAWNQRRVSRVHCGAVSLVVLLLGGWLSLGESLPVFSCLALSEGWRGFTNKVGFSKCRDDVRWLLVR